MTGKELFLEIGNIKEEYVAEAEKYQSENKSSILAVLNTKVAGTSAFHKTLATAACLVVCAGLVFTVQKLGVRNDTAKESAMENEMIMESTQEEMQDIYKREEDAGPETEASKVSEAAQKTDELKDELKMEAAAEEKINESIEEMQSGNDSGRPIGEAAKESGEMPETVTWDAESVKKKMASYPDGFDDILKLDGVFVLVHGKAEKGQDIWEAFLKHVDAGEAAQAEIVRFTVEGDPIIETVYYDGETFYLCVDNSRDAYRGEGNAYFEEKYSSLVQEEKALDAGGKTIEYTLTDGENEYSIVYIAE